MSRAARIRRVAAALLGGTMAAGLVLLLAAPVAAIGTDAIVITVAETQSSNSVYSVAIDGNGNTFFSTYNGSGHVVRMADSEGTITTVAGNGTNGVPVEGAVATDTPMNHAQGLAVDSGGNLYISIVGSHRVYMVDTDGIITTVAGNGRRGYNPADDGAAATAATLNSPRDIALDSAGNLYIADRQNHRIRKVDTDGIITTVAGNGRRGYNPADDGAAATAATLNYPWGVATDGAGNIYIADRDNHRIRKVDADGIITTVAGNGSTGYNPAHDGAAATDATLYSPSNVEVDAAGNLYINDQSNFRVRKVDTDGIITTVIGNGSYNYNIAHQEGAQADEISLGHSQDIAVDANGDVTFVPNNGNNNILKALHDVVDPTILILRPTDGLTVWENTNLTALFSCADDGGSGVASCSATLNGEPILHGEAVDTGVAGDLTLTVEATDKVGNTSSMSHTIAVVADDTAPGITIASPVANTTVDTDTEVFADFSCEDEVDGSGLRSCRATINGQPINNGDAIDTSTDGWKIMVVSASDRAGNTSTAVNVLTVQTPDVPPVLAFSDCDRAITGDHAGGTGMSASIARLYMAVFARQPDADGHAYWLDRADNGISINTISALFIDSDEFQATYASLTDAEFIEQLYGNVLCREPDAEGSNFWSEQLTNGLSRGGMVLLFSEGPEFKRLTGTN